MGDRWIGLPMLGGEGLREMSRCLGDLERHTFIYATEFIEW